MTTALQAQPEITLEDIYAKGTFRARGVPQPTWLEDGRSYSAFTADGLVRVDAATLAETVVVPASAFIPEGAERPLRMQGYECRKTAPNWSFTRIPGGSGGATPGETTGFWTLPPANSANSEKAWSPPG